MPEHFDGPKTPDNCSAKRIRLWARIKKLIRSPGFLVLVLVLVYMAAVSSYNDITQPAFTVIVRDTTEDLSEFSDGRTIRELKDSYEFALLSADVYEGEELSKNLCKSEGSLSRWSELGEAALRNVRSVPKDSSDWHGDFADGLVYNIYYRHDLNSNGEQVVALVFRGTDGGVSDLWSNLHWLTRWVAFTYNQYDLVRDIAPELVKVIEEHEEFQGKRVRIIAAGHSLGGGLAQQAAYAADGIETVYAFDSSSVTGFYDVDKSDRDARAKKMRIYRIYERGEILAYLRRFMAQIYPVAAQSPKIVEARYNFQNLSGGFIDLHNMENLACNLRMVATSPLNLQSGATEAR